MSDKHINEEENEDMNKSGKVIAGVVMVAGASLAIVGGAYAYNKSNSTPKEAKIVTSSQVSSSSVQSASFSTPKESSSASFITPNSSSASASISAQEQAATEAAVKAAEEARLRQEEEARIAAEQQAAARAAEEAERAAREEEARRQQPEPVYDEPSYEPDPEPTPSQGSGEIKAGDVSHYGYVYTEEDIAARAEGYDNAAQKAYCEREGLLPVTQEDLDAWGITVPGR